jgi:regulatory protein
MAAITALRAVGRRVAVELDGAAWRTVPVAAVVEARLTVGAQLDRERARALARALRRRRAQDVAVRALARRDHSRASLEARLARARIPAVDRRDVLDRAARSGLVDDVRFAEQRARRLAERGAGDLLVLDDLVRHGIDEPVARQALSALEPESERAARIVEARKVSARTIRHLASRGFSEETLEALIAEFESRALR